MSNNASTPQVIHLGKKSRKEINRYRQGIGTMHMEVQQLIAQAKQTLGADQEVLPLVVVHRKKKRKFSLFG